MTVAGSASRMLTQVRAGELRTASTTSPRIAMPNTLNSARPTSLSSMNGYSSTALSWAANRIAEGSRLTSESTAGT